MRSKFLCLALCLTMSLALLNTGCDRIFQQSQAPEAPLDPALGFQPQCLANTLDTLKAFMDGSADPAAVSAVWTCFGNAITVFEKKVQGSQQNEYSSREVATFFENHFLKDVKISDPLLDQIMHFKVLFVGGNLTVITKPEMLALANFANQMNGISQQLLPYMKVLSLNWQLTPDDNYQKNVQYFEDANTAMQQAVGQLVGMIAKNQQGYDLRNLLVLFAEIDRLSPLSSGFLTTFSHIFPVIEQVKAVLTGTDPDVIQPSEWNRFGMLTARGYIQFLRYYYFVEQADQAGPQFVYFSNSLDDLFGFLGDMVATKPNGQLTKAELVQLLTSLNSIFDGLNFTEDLVTQVMKIKVLVFGGSADTWVPADFQRAQGKVAFFRSLLERLWTYGSFYAGSWNPSELSEDESQQYFASGQANLYLLLNDTAKNLESGYDLQDLTQLAQALDELIVDPKNKFKWAQELESFVPMVVGIKQIILSPTGTVIQQTDWPVLLNFAGNAIGRYLYYEYFISPRTILSGPGLDSMDQFVKQVVSLLGQLTSRPSRPVVTYAELQNLVAAAANGGLLPASLQASSLNAALQGALGKIFLDPKTRLGGYVATGLSQLTLSSITKEYSLWSELQHFYNQVLASDTATITPANLQKQIASSSLSALAKQDAGMLFQGTPLLVFDANGQLTMNSKTAAYDRKALTTASYGLVIARALINGYAADQKRIDSGAGIIEAEAELAYADFKPLAVDFKLLEPTNTTFAKSRFFEANIFVPSANGDSYVNLTEGSQLVEMILSGLKVSDVISAKIADNCTVQKGASSTQDQLSVTCVLGIYENNYAEVFAQLPDFVKYLKARTAAQRHDMVYNFLQTAGWTVNSTGVADRSDVDLIPFVFQYSETVFQRYDINHDGYFDFNEVNLAYPYFASLIQSISHKGGNSINEAALIFIIQQGRVPCGTGDDLSVLGIALKLFGGSSGGITVHADRQQIATVLGAIAGTVNAPAGAKCTKPSTVNFQTALPAEN